MPYERPRQYEFDTRTKRQAIQRAGNECEECGDGNVNLYVHHALGIWYAVNLYPQIPAWLVSSIDNAVVLCSTCHVEYDNRMREEHHIQAIALLGILDELK